MQEINQTGIITKITAKDIYIKVARPSSCHNCFNKINCSLSQCQEKLIKLPLPLNFSKKPGDSIKLKISNKQGNIAILLGFILPLLLTVLTLITFLKGFKQTENVSASATLIIICLYYLILSFLKHKLNKIFKIQICSE